MEFPTSVVPVECMVTPVSPPPAKNNAFNELHGPTGVYAVEQNKSLRKQTPATSVSHRTQENGNPPHIKNDDPHNIKNISEEDSDDCSTFDTLENRVMSPAAQAAALSSFLSVVNSDSDEGESQARIADIYREPLDLDGIETVVLGILRTGKLTIQGKPGDVTKIQPALFALQANEKDLPRLLPQIMQTPLFNQNDLIQDSVGSSPTPLTIESLQNGQFCLGLYIDTAIYTLLKGHCAKNAKQAEAIITTLMSTGYISVNSITGPTLPPMLFHSQLVKRSSIGTLGISNGKKSSNSSLSSSGTSGCSVKTSSSSSLDDERLVEINDVKKVVARPRVRKESIAIGKRHQSISDDDENIQSRWKTSIVDNSLLVSQYGDTTIPMLMWNPKLTVDFQVKSSIGPYCGIVTGIDPSNKTVTIKVVNSSSSHVAFSIRSFRQSTMYESQVACPLQGLEVLEAGTSWEDSVELHPLVIDKGTSEIFVIDLLVCSLEDQPSWNVLRKYAAMKGVKSDSSKPQLQVPKRMHKKRHSIFYMPGTKEQKEDNMKVLISHGLQCVVKGKLDEAEVIFTQALMLPDFQRIELKAFVYVCLAVVANKRQNKGHVNSLLTVLNEVSAASQLVDAVENTRGTMRMPRMIQLVKQLRKELDVEKIFREHRQRTDGMKSPKRVDELQMTGSETVTPVGGTLSCNSTTLHIPQSAVKEPTQITLSSPEPAQLDGMLKHAGWDSTVKIIAAVQIDCAPITTRFSVPIEITTALTHKVTATSQCLRLVHSNYLRHWQDLTNDPCSSVVVTGDKLVIKSDRSGWLAVTSVHFDPSQIVLKAMRSLSAEPLMLHFSVYGLTILNTRLIQVATFVSPHSATQEKPQHHLPISFSQAIQAYPGEKLKLTFQGPLEPESSMNEQNLIYEFNVSDRQTSICEKWLRMTSPAEVPLCGMIIVSSCSNNKVLAEMRLSSNNGFANSSSATTTRTDT